MSKTANRDAYLRILTSRRKVAAKEIAEFSAKLLDTDSDGDLMDPHTACQYKLDSLLTATARHRVTSIVINAFLAREMPLSAVGERAKKEVMMRTLSPGSSSSPTWNITETAILKEWALVLEAIEEFDHD